MRLFFHLYCLVSFFNYSDNNISKSRIIKTFFPHNNVDLIYEFKQNISSMKKKKMLFQNVTMRKLFFSFVKEKKNIHILNFFSIPLNVEIKIQMNITFKSRHNLQKRLVTYL